MMTLYFGQYSTYDLAANVPGLELLLSGTDTICTVVMGTTTIMKLSVNAPVIEWSSDDGNPSSATLTFYYDNSKLKEHWIFWHLLGKGLCQAKCYKPGGII